MDDRKILALLLRRSEAGLTAMEAAYGRRLYRTAMNLLCCTQDAEECVNDTYLAVWNTVPPKEPDPLSAYVYRIGRNHALNRLRANTAQKRGGSILSLDELEGCIPAPCLQDGRALGEAINGYLSTLSALSRAVFLRRYWFGDSVKDIAKDFSMTPNALSVRLNRIREGLNAYLIQEGYYE